MKRFEEDSPHHTGRGRGSDPNSSHPLHAVDTSSSNTPAGHDDDHQDQNHQQDHDDSEISDDNSMTHADLDDANENTADTD